MKIYVNNKETETADNASVQQLVAQLGLPQTGVAVAINNKMVPKTEWDNTTLCGDDHVVIIKAACGG